MPSNANLSNGRATAYHDNSWHGDDAFVTRELTRTTALDAVLDGATHRGGRQASGLAAAMLSGAVVETVKDLAIILEAANLQLFQRGKGRFFLTTVSVALKIDAELHVLSVGDSPAFLFRGGDVVPLTATAKGPTFLGVANTLGRSEKLSYKATCVSLQKGDRLVLATDGFIDNVAPEELAALVSRASSPEEAVSALRQLLSEKQRKNRGRLDDHTGFRRDDATALIRYIGVAT